MWKLEGKNITKFFGGVSALKGVSFILSEGEIVGLIGPNGAGKTTLFNVVTGVYNPEKGTIYFDGKNISNLKPYQICRQGIGRTFQIPRPFLEMNCIDNVMISIVSREKKIFNKDEKLREAKKALKFVGLDGYEKVLGKNLTLIQKKKLEIARALATNPRLILLDEVFAGLNTSEIRSSVKLIKRIRDELGITQFWIEHIMGVIMETAERIIVLDNGEKIGEGTPKEIAKDKRVIKAYLGDTNA